MTTTDRELLDSAAKAAGIELRWFSHLRRDGVDLEPKISHIGNTEWNPLADDADAFRLAVALRIDLQMFAAQSTDPWVRACVDRAGKAFSQQVVSGDAAAATRRAIVRAAAALAAA